MATGVSDEQIDRLANCLSKDDMVKIAEDYMDISDEIIKNRKFRHKDPQDFNRDIIRYWTVKNPDNQIQVTDITHIQ